MTTERFDTILQSITFGKKILTIPTLDEMGIPMAGLSIVEVDKRLYDNRYSGGCWVNRGDVLLTYKFRFYTNEKPSLRAKFVGEDPMWDFTTEIKSPISGLVISFREEDCVDLSLGGLQYQWVKKKALPIILVPNDEPMPDSTNFYEYTHMASTLAMSFYMMPIRNRANVRTERLSAYINDENSSVFLEYLEKLRGRDSDSFHGYDIREITEKDQNLIMNIQNLRGKDLLLREKLVHLAREFGDSI